MERYSPEYRDHLNDLRKHEESPRHQKRAVIELVGFCHGLISAGTLGEFVEPDLRRRVDRVCAEFGLDRLPAKSLEPAE